MKIELVEEVKPGEQAWYTIQVDGQHIKGTYDRQKAEDFYQKILNDINFLNTKKTILRSEEVKLNLEL